MNSTLYNSDERTKIYRIIEVLLRQKWAIMITAATVFAIVGYFTFKQVKLYEATSIVMVKSNDAGSGLGIVDFSGEAARKLENELEILKSRELLIKIADTLVNAYCYNREWKDIPLIIRTAVKASKTRDFHSYKIREILAGMIGKNASFDISKEKDVIKISYTSTSPADAAMVANIYSDCYYLNDLTRSRSNAAKVRKFLESQSLQKLSELKESEGRLQGYMERQGASGLSEKSNLLIQKIVDLKSTIETNDLEYRKNSMMLDDYKKGLNKVVPRLTEKMVNVDDLYIQELQRTLARTEAERDVAKVINSSESGRPEYIKEMTRKNHTIDSLKNHLSKRSRDYINGNMNSYSMGNPAGTGDIVTRLSGEIQMMQLKNATILEGSQMMKKTLGKYESEFNCLPQKGIGLASMTRDKEFNEKLYLRIGEQYQEALLAELSTFGRVEILDRADVPFLPVSPKIIANLIIGGIIGLMLGICAAFVLNFFFNNVNSPKDLENMGMRLLSTIPRIQLQQETSVKMIGSGNESDTLLNSKSAYSNAIESYQRLQIYLTYAFLDKNIKSLLITSSGPGEGKSATAANLAVTIANSGKRVLLVDMDMRKPAVHKYFKVNPSPSLAHYLYRKKTLEEIIRPGHVKGLDIITSIEFPQNIALLFTSARMKQFMDLVHSMYDFIIYDTPPVNAVTDAIHLSKNVDEVIMVARANKTNMEELNRAAQLFEQFHIKLGGVVLNDFDASKLQHYYGRYYGYYSQDEKENKKIKKNQRNRMLLKPEQMNVQNSYSGIFTDFDDNAD